VSLRERQKQVLASKDVIRDARPGAVYTVTDAAIRFPATDEASRSYHAVRWVILIQSTRLCQAASPRTVLVLPCSSSHRGKLGSYDLSVPRGTDGFDAEAVVAYVSLIQPILKADLKQYQGFVGMEFLSDIWRTLASVVGLSDGQPTKP